ncbi:TetR family transcriptional regulator (plasmid) [Bacillus mycoides]|nr:TetR family transcriptional regulator [Bacillus mycoides]QWI14385.1 TetR family transcriptional regulator [Bacillus mycoides]QWI57997.1 TetR family transcriptional regulator [Bacillus mycoides]QWI92630.1 TetR family transcriptional regulator [Bacillus mycoides]QWJ03546.1 TetR family transcriptional regulator [Bacillus mycoides]
MGRSIKFNKEHILNKAMYLFWEKGYMLHPFQIFST